MIMGEEEERSSSPPTSLTYGGGGGGGGGGRGEGKGRFWKLFGKCVSPSIKAQAFASTTHSISTISSSQTSAQPNGKSGGVTSILANNLMESQSTTRVLTDARSFPFTPKAVEDLRNIEAYGNVVVFAYREIQQITENFRPDLIIGEGGFGVVYKGVIDESARRGFKDSIVAVKVLNPDGYQGDKEWLAEVNHLGQLSHPNLVKLIGYCCEGTHRILVYEYMACGCVEKHLFRRVCQTMPWPVRIKIALGAAKGLAFLHEGERPVIYRDFKTANILLDEDFNAKLSDFGLAKEGPSGDQTHVSTRVMGTYGYAAPEYVMTGHLTAWSDVYGYGVVLLEMLIGKRATYRGKPTREHNLVEWARPLLVHNKKLLKIIDPRMEGQYTDKDIRKVATLAHLCLSPSPKGRPTMGQVVQLLEDIREFPECNKPQPPHMDGSKDVVASTDGSNDARVRSSSCKVVDGFEHQDNTRRRQKSYG